MVRWQSRLHTAALAAYLADLASSGTSTSSSSTRSQEFVDDLDTNLRYFHEDLDAYAAKNRRRTASRGSRSPSTSFAQLGEKKVASRQQDDQMNHEERSPHYYNRRIPFTKAEGGGDMTHLHGTKQRLRNSVLEIEEKTLAALEMITSGGAVSGEAPVGVAVGAGAPAGRSGSASASSRTSSSRHLFSDVGAETRPTGEPAVVRRAPYRTKPQSGTAKKQGGVLSTDTEEVEVDGSTRRLRTENDVSSTDDGAGSDEEVTRSTDDDDDEDTPATGIDGSSVADASVADSVAPSSHHQRVLAAAGLGGGSAVEMQSKFSSTTGMSAQVKSFILFSLKAFILGGAMIYTAGEDFHYLCDCDYCTQSSTAVSSTATTATTTTTAAPVPAPLISATFLEDPAPTPEEDPAPTPGFSLASTATGTTTPCTSLCPDGVKFCNKAGTQALASLFELLQDQMR
mmetsp:Transcript_9169/g.22480  ORF Transcript_9169/g.22480 Transcript_9169/m.22480 type:complete len:455 (-) Transcript_9169:409-1773(-)|eukprot:CAMPEP_0178987458 /NCGR_PEP_ID=MMETSP0795-20121207/3277_1 /TAXON_ID=88552 /ORGANISM="Amoebophrya sp., Strain Ameob2" /LENGTH=454 /DNA_ID=CAMNT_0020678645 /DNA_START=107 /DNA_END=1471 /DNA_ORIENTATION=+